MSLSNVSSHSATDATKAYLRQQPLLKRGLGHMVRIEDSSKDALSHITVLQDVSTALFPRIMVSRTGIEAAESTFVELFENVVVYYSIPFIGSKLFKPLIQKTLPKVDPALMMKNLSGIPEHLKPQVLPAKAALIVGALGTAVASEFIINFSKPLLTAKLTGKTDFSDVVGLHKAHPHLSKNENAKQKTDPEFVDKMERRLKYSLAATAGIFAASLGVAKLGAKNPTTRKALEAFVNKLDFEHSPKGLALGKDQMRLFMAFAFPAYLSACRDNLERVETATRLAIILPYLGYFYPEMKKHISQHLAKKTPEAFKLKDGQQVVKTLQEIQADARQKVLAKFPNISETELMKKVAQESKAAFSARLKTFGIPMGVGIVGVGLGVSLLNRFWTNYRFRHQHTDPHALSPVQIPVPQGQRLNANNPFELAV